MVADLVDRFIREVPRRLSLIAAAIDGDPDPAALHAAAELRGLTEALGASDASLAAARLEEALRTGTHPSPHAVMEAAGDAIGALADSLRGARDAGWPPR